MKNITGLLLTEEGELTEVIVKGDGRGSHIDSMYEHIKCRNVDCIGLPTGIDLWVDDEFIYAESLPNLELSLTAITLGWPGRHIIKGNGLFLSIKPSTGESISLNDDQKRQVRDAFAWARKRVNEVLLDGLRTIREETQ